MVGTESSEAVEASSVTATALEPLDLQAYRRAASTDALATARHEATSARLEVVKLKIAAKYGLRDGDAFDEATGAIKRAAPKVAAPRAATPVEPEPEPTPEPTREPLRSKPRLGSSS